MNLEIDALVSRRTWTLVSRLQNVNIVICNDTFFGNESSRHLHCWKSYVS
ncbi:unnamed protein product [Spirodela intermedia]|uniref:Uncharacterized protein n=1 Tax=Spirodela intermedia TaxID=51605 RepID=A0A7I8JZ95_SPIIN|nr:unnamed protein product [Spirodela intermedia]